MDSGAFQISNKERSTWITFDRKEMPDALVASIVSFAAPLKGLIL